MSFCNKNYHFKFYRDCTNRTVTLISVCVKFQEKPVKNCVVFLTTTKDVGMFWRLEIQSGDRREM